MVQARLADPVPRPQARPRDVRSFRDPALVALLPACVIVVAAHRVWADPIAWPDLLDPLRLLQRVNSVLL